MLDIVFGMNNATLILKWRHTIVSIMDRPKYCKMKKQRKLCVNFVQIFIKMVDRMKKNFRWRFLIVFPCIADSTPLCCDGKIVQDMATNIKLATGAYGRCDSCILNLQKTICAMSCSPTQSLFMHPTVAEGCEYEMAIMPISISHKIYSFSTCRWWTWRKSEIRFIG